MWSQGCIVRLQLPLGVMPMQYVINAMAILTVMLVSLQMSLVISRGLLSLVLLSMRRWQSRDRN
jgi:hypothetical protein